MHITPEYSQSHTNTFTTVVQSQPVWYIQDSVHSVTFHSCITRSQLWDTENVINNSIRSFTWQGLETSSWPSSRSLDRPTLQRHWICSCQSLETGHPNRAMVERRDDPSWLRDDDIS